MFKTFEYQNCHFMQYIPFIELGLMHVFTTRPQAMGVFRSSETEIMENFNRVKSLFNNSSSLFFMKQAHTNKVVDINSVDKISHHLGHYVEDVDGLLSDKPQQMLFSTYADCIPILVFDAKQKIQINIHSGWLGTLTGILYNALELLIQHYKSNPKDIYVLSGPHLLWDDFEVDEDVAHRFIKKFPDINDLYYTQANKYYIDLNKVNSFFCSNHLLPKENVHFMDISTLKDKTMHSYRKDKQDYKQMALISYILD